MKKIKGLLFLAISIMIMLALSACSGESKTGAITLSQKSVNFADVGESLSLTATVMFDGAELDAENLADEVVWQSSNSNVAICEGGVVTAVGYGSCRIRASYGNYTASCSVYVPNPSPKLALSSNEVLLDNIGDTASVLATSDTGEDLSSRATWISSNPSIALCDDGVITAVGYGSCRITILVNNRTAICNVTVNNPTAPAVTLSETHISLKAKETRSLVAKTSYAAGNAVFWLTSDSSVATCDEFGNVTATGNGKCAVIAVTENGYTAVCVVTVGDTDKKLEHEQYLTYEFRDLYKNLNYIDSSTGQVISTAMVIDYSLDTLLLSDGRLVVETTLTCVKTYDADGADGNTPAVLTASIYKENDVFCDKRQYKAINVAVGDTFEVKCMGFTVQTNTDGTARELYCTFSSISEQ